MRYWLILALAGCATTKLVDIDYTVKPPADWPALEERITYADVQTLQRWCNMPKGMRAYNCAVVSFRYGLCMIYLSDKNDAAALAHERAHCQGYGHVGESNVVHRAWERFKKSPSDALVAQ